MVKITDTGHLKTWIMWTQKGLGKVREYYNLIQKTALDIIIESTINNDSTKNTQT